MGDQPEFLPIRAMSSWDKFIHPDDHATVEEVLQKRALQVRAENLIEMREKAGLTQVEAAEVMGFRRGSRQHASAIENGAVAG
jgi:DNA-binding XRE family transcriptional regulator